METSTTTSSSVQWFARADRTLGSEPAALEVGVEVSGTHAGPSGARELFSESTVTTLVFEDGVVVRLSASVIDGQLLFLKHLESQREVVTRVLRQRSISPANTYVELEFTEVVPGFWGSEPMAARSDMAENLPVRAEASEFAGYELLEDAPPPRVPDDAEASRLRDEVTALRSQMSAMLEPSAPVRPSGTASTLPRDTAPDPSSVISTLLGPEKASAGAEETATGLASALATPVAGSEEVAAEMMVEPAPTRRITPRIRMLAALLVLVFVVGVAYEKGLLANGFGMRGLSASSASVNAGAVAQPVSIKAAAGSAAATAQSVGAAANGTASKDETSATTAAAHDGSGTGDERGSGSSRLASDAQVARKDGASPELASRGNRVPVTLRETDSSASAVADVGESGYVAPSLVKSVNAVAPPDALREFVTGDVKFDALVDTTGKVTSASVISGPAALRSAALEALRGYQYKPASKNGQAVPGRVSVTVKFWYEP